MRTPEEKRLGQLAATQRWRARNPEKIKERDRIRQESGEKARYSRNRRNAFRDLISKIKTDNPCVDCKHFFPAECMDFDHVSDKKKKAVSHLVSDGQSMAQILAEIKKCELVCANCHRIRTARALRVRLRTSKSNLAAALDPARDRS